MSEWVDFKKLKSDVNMQMVLEHYGVKNLTKDGDELRGPCPIHKGSAGSKNFTVNPQKSAFKCFSPKCKAKGNILDFVTAMEGCDIRTAAVKIAGWFRVGESQVSSPDQGADTAQRIGIQRGIYRDKGGALYEVLVNAENADHFEPLVVYRELFGDYKFWVASPENFGAQDSHLTLVKPL